MARFLSILIFVLFTSSLHAQEALMQDTSGVTVRNFSSSSLQKFKSDPAFQYDLSADKPKSWWNEFWNAFWRKVGELFDFQSGTLTTRVVLGILALIILVAVVLIAMNMRKGGLFGKKNSYDPLAYSVEEEDIHALNFDAAIEQAIKERNFRYAVRLLYLQTLKNLTDANIINWQLNKTNAAYLVELAGKAYQQHFRKLTFQFESNWYGDLPIDDIQFQQVRDEFNRFNKNLS